MSCYINLKENVNVELHKFLKKQKTKIENKNILIEDALFNTDGIYKNQADRMGSLMKTIVNL